MNPPNEIDKYISGFPDNIQKLLQLLRETIRRAAPDAVEVISYQMPAFKMNGILVYFAGYKNHVGFYPTAKGIEAFKSEFADFKWSKGTVQFPIDKPIPIDLVTRIVKFKVDENLSRLKKKPVSRA
jgi:uncharacterized protein YdhG (YjbR/CyaY superfamily)